MRPSSVVRALWILQLLGREPEPLTLSQIAGRLGMPKATAHGILRDLLNEHFVELRPGKAYRIGVRAFEVSSARLREGSDAWLVAPHLEQLTLALGVTSHYAILDGQGVVYICKEDPPGPAIQLASQVGIRLPAHLTAVGRACLAYMDSSRISDHVDLKVKDRQQRTMSQSELVAILDETRRRGYAVDDGETAGGIKCVAAPIFDSRECRGAIGVSYPAGAVSKEDDVPGCVRATAADVSRLFGGDPSAAAGLTSVLMQR